MTERAASLHVHSDYSHDGVDSLEAIREASLTRGISTVCLTDHAEDLDAAAFAEYTRHCAALSDTTFAFIPGLEFRFAAHRGVHLLALGTWSWLTPTTLQEFFADAARLQAFTVLAHPLTCRYSPPAVVAEHVDGIEVWNARYNTRYLPDIEAVTLYQRLAATRSTLKAVVGLDQHDLRIYGGLRINLWQSDGTDVIAKLRRGEYANAGRDLAFNSRAAIPEQRMRSLRIQRYLLTAAVRFRRRIGIATRRLGFE